MAKLNERHFKVLRMTADEDAYWTGDIATDAALSTRTARADLERLERHGFVTRVVQGEKGLPSSWRRTPAGRAALASHTEDAGR